MKRIVSLLLSVFFVTSFEVSAEATQTEWIKDYVVEVTQSQLPYPKALLVLPNDAILVAHRDGYITRIAEGVENARFSLPLPQLFTEGQGGVLDILLVSGFGDKSVSNQVDASGQLLISYSKGTASNNKLAVVSVWLSLKDGVINVAPVYEVNESKDTPVHFGGKLLALSHGGYLVTTGDGFDYREKAQVLSSHLGKVIGFTLNGKPLPSAPFDSSPYVYSLGHRNPQGLVYFDGNVYQHEHGPAGGDELNKLTKGANYGWPVVTLGKDYSGANISPFTHYENMQSPLINWTPSIAPSSMTVYHHDAFTTLNDSLLITTLKAKQLLAVSLHDKELSAQRIFSTLDERLRDVDVDGLGNILVLTDGEEAKILKISPLSTM